MCYWAYSVILGFGGKSTLSRITGEFSESWKRAQTSTPRRVKKEARSEETAVAAGITAVAPASDKKGFAGSIPRSRQSQPRSRH